MTCKDYMKAIREELNGSMGYYWKAKEAQKSEDMEAAKYLAKLATNEFEHAGILMKMMDQHIKEKTAHETYTGVYKDIYDMSMEMLTDEYHKTEELLRKG